MHLLALFMCKNGQNLEQLFRTYMQYNKTNIAYPLHLMLLCRPLSFTAHLVTTC